MILLVTLLTIQSTKVVNNTKLSSDLLSFKVSHPFGRMNCVQTRYNENTWKRAAISVFEHGNQVFANMNQNSLKNKEAKYFWFYYTWKIVYRA